MSNSINLSQPTTLDDTITINGSTNNWSFTGASPTYTLSAGTSSNLSWTNTSISVDPALYGATLEVKGDANFDGDIKVKGKSIVDSLDRIEERLAILRPNDDLEEKWENLRGLRKMYMELEAEIIEKEKIWNILKK